MMMALALVPCLVAVLAANGAGVLAERTNRVSFPECPHGPHNNRIIQGTEDYEADEIEISDCHMDTLNINQYVLPNITWVTIENNSIENWESLDNLYHKWNTLDIVSIFHQNNINEATETLLQGLNVTYLEVFYCSLREVPEFAVQSSSLELLQLKYNDITALDKPDMFSSLVNLYDLEIPFNQISYIHADIFKPLTNLKYICLNYNRIQYIDETLFQSLSKLIHLDLSYNQIQYLPPKMFSGTENLEKLYLTSNRLTDLPANFIIGLNSLWIFNIDENPWQCACLCDIQAEVKIKGMKWSSSNECVQIESDTDCHRHDEYLRLYDSRKRVPVCLGKATTTESNLETSNSVK